MSNTLNSNQNSSPYGDLLGRLTEQMREKQHLDDQILQILKNGFEDAFEKEQIILTRQERVRLFCQVTKAMLDEIIDNVNDAI